jgi:hypothetical protein
MPSKPRWPLGRFADISQWRADLSPCATDWCAVIPCVVLYYSEQFCVIKTHVAHPPRYCVAGWRRVGLDAQLLE